MHSRFGTMYAVYMQTVVLSNGVCQVINQALQTDDIACCHSVGPIWPCRSCWKAYAQIICSCDHYNVVSVTTTTTTTTLDWLYGLVFVIMTTQKTAYVILMYVILIV